MLTRTLVDVRPLRTSRAFRRWWVGSLLSGLGSQLTAFAATYYVWSTTHRPALVGGLALAELVPTVAGALVGGSLADRTDRRRLVLVARVGQLVATAALALVATGSPGSLVPVFVLVAGQAGLAALAAPAVRSFTVRLLPAEQLGAGLALSRLSLQACLLTGPLLAGVLTALVGVRLCFAVDALTFLTGLWGVAGLPAMRPEHVEGGPDLRGLPAAVRLVLGNPVLLGAFATDLAATVLAMPVALFPVVNAELYGGSPVTLGLFAPAIGLGGIVAGALSGHSSRSSRPGRLMLVAAGAWGLALAGFGATHVLWFGLACLAVAGAADTVSVVARGVVVQHAVPDAVRGRVNALDHLVGVSGPQLGSFRAGLVASASSGAAAAVLGGLTSLVAVGLVAAGTPSLRRWRPVDSVSGAIPRC
ncbi:MAG: MFS transporter [Nocardioidaceae bacterium]|nr:MFS transporter [Nocardioidaceae bacterium]